LQDEKYISLSELAKDPCASSERVRDT
jgi:hypothetical protein